MVSVDLVEISVNRFFGSLSKFDQTNKNKHPFQTTHSKVSPIRRPSRRIFQSSVPSVSSFTPHTRSSTKRMCLRFVRSLSANPRSSHIRMKFHPGTGAVHSETSKFPAQRITKTLDVSVTHISHRYAIIIRWNREQGLSPRSIRVRRHLRIFEIGFSLFTCTLPAYSFS